MNSTSIYTFIESELLWALDNVSNINVKGIADDLADNLKSNGYCSDPYFEFDKALTCPINKRREKYCGCTHCASHEFCMKLRKEGYV
jgi:hypothetical protein